LWSSRFPSSLDRRGADDDLERVAIEAAAGARVAGDPDLLDLHEQRVGIAVERRLAHELHVARGVALAPVLLAGSRPERDAPLREGASQRLAVHPAEHEHLAGVPLLDDGGQQPVGVEGGPVERGSVRRPRLLVAFELLVTGFAHRTILPSTRSAALTSPTVTSPLWKTDAASTASAPTAIAGAKWATLPAPPDAMTGTLESSCMSAVSSRSKPAFVPSASMELTSNSPAPSSIARRAQSRASRSVSVRPPWVVTTKPDSVRSERLTSSESTSTCAPKRSAISAMRPGRAIAALLTPILSAPWPRRRATSSFDRTPPPTVSGMNTCSATRCTMS